MRSRVMLLGLVGGLIVGSCGSGESNEALPEAAPFHAVPDDAVAVVGTATCDPFWTGGLLTVECVLDMSDPRVSGNEIHPDTHFFAAGLDGRVWMAEEAVITNEEGTWRGSSQGAEDLDGIPAGEAHYVGEGAYEGLVFHYYFFHADLDEKAELRGWISGGG